MQNSKAIEIAGRFSPWGLASSGTEHGHQAALFAFANRAVWAGLECADTPQAWAHSSEIAKAWAEHASFPVMPDIVPALRWLHAIPNGGERGKASAGNMKAEGVKSGVADIFLPVPYDVTAGYTHDDDNRHGLYIEMKRVNGVPSDLSQQQKDFGAFVLSQGYAWCWAKGWLDAKAKLCAYMSGAWSAEMERI